MIIPKHIAIILDGNRTWARRKGWPAAHGHRRVAEQVIRELVETGIGLGVQYLTLWVFSTENWQRSPQEVRTLMNIFREIFTKEASKLHELGVRIQTIGDLSRFEQDIQDNILKWVSNTRNNDKITVVFALNYGGRDELLRAVEKITKQVKADQRPAKKLSELEFAKYLDTADLPDPELIIRPGGQQRLSGFLLWQNNYSELYFTEVLMPEFGAKELKKAIKEFNSRQRKFGK